VAIIKGVCIFFNIINNYKYIKVFKFLVHLGIGAYLSILPKGLYYYNLLLLKGPFCFKPITFYKIFI